MENFEFLYHQIDWPIIIEKYKNKLYFDQTSLKHPLIARFFTTSSVSQSFDQLASIDLHWEIQFTRLNPSWDFASLLKRIEKCAIFNFYELFQLLRLIRCSNYHYAFIQKIPHFTSIKSASNLILKYCLPLEKILDDQGELIEENCPELLQINQEIQQLHAQAINKISHLLQNHHWQKRLQIRQYDIIHNHYVLPIKSTHYQAHLGSIIDRSDSGSTFHVSPINLMDFNRKRILLINKKAKILAKMLEQFSLQTHSYYQDFTTFWEQLLFLDQLLGKKSLCHDWNLYPCVLHEPQSNADLQLYDMMHPLLETSVSNDVILSKDFKGMAISGPNMGGKTILLKTVLLCHLFPLCGLYIPAKNSHITIYKNLYFMANIQQDIEKNLSSFGMEIYCYLKLSQELENTDGALIIMDEIFNTTSSEDATPIAYAFIQDFMNKNNTRCFISTHHQQLKMLFLQQSRIQSACMIFDSISYKPTFKLQLGMPGQSMAISTLKMIESKYFSSQKITEKAINATDSSILEMDLQIKKLLELKQSILLEKEEWDKEHLKRQEDMLKQKELILDNFKSELHAQQEFRTKKFKEEQEKILLEKAKIKFLSKMQEQNRSEYKQLHSIQEVSVGTSYYMLSIKGIIEVERVNLSKKIIYVKTQGKNSLKIQTKFEDLFYYKK